MNIAVLYFLATKDITSLTCYLHDNGSGSSVALGVSYITRVSTRVH